MTAQGCRSLATNGVTRTSPISSTRSPSSRGDAVGVLGRPRPEGGRPALPYAERLAQLPQFEGLRQIILGAYGKSRHYIWAAWADFLRLANALSALYPKDSEEKRLLDAMLLAVPR